MKERVPRSMSRSMRMVSGTLGKSSIHQRFFDISIHIIIVIGNIIIVILIIMIVYRREG